MLVVIFDMVRQPHDGHDSGLDVMGPVPQGES